MFFTQEDYLKIEKWLKARAVKDSQFDEVLDINNISDEDYITFIKNGINKKIKLNNFISGTLNRIDFSDYAKIADCVDLTSEQTINAAKTFSAGISMDNTRIFKVKEPTDSTDAANKEYVDTQVNTMFQDTYDEGFWICDETGKAIARLDILDSADFGDTLKKRLKDLIIDNHLTDTLADGFFIANNDGDVIAKYDGNEWVMSGVPSANLTVRNGTISKKIDMTVGERLILTRNSVTNDNTIAFVGKISETFGELTIGHGYGKGNAWGEDSQWTASWIVIDSADIKVYEERNQANDSDRLVATIPHGLTISGDIKVSIVKQTKDVSAINKAVLIVSSQGIESVNEILWYSCTGDIYAYTTSALTECRLSWSCSKLAGGTWIFGDSFISPIGQTKWPYYLIQNGFLNWALNAHGGERAKEAFMELENLLEIAFPKTIIWAEAMNNPDTEGGEVNEEWMLYYKKVKEVCLKYNIELILTTAPTSNAEKATEGHDGRKSMHEAQNAFIRSCGDRYIDLAAAVGADGSGDWNPIDLKNSFDVHPSKKGAKVLYMQAIADAPELTL